MIKLLVKNRLLSLFGSIIGKGKGTQKKARPIKIFGIALLYLYVIASFAFLSATMAYTIGSVLIPYGASWLYFAIFIIATFSLIFIFSIFETKSELFECKDNNLLLSMPIKPRDIVAARISVVLIYNYVESLVIMLPCVVCYGIISSDIVGVIGGIIITLFIPIISTSIASAVGYAVAYMTKRIKRKNLFTMFFSIGFMMAYFIGYNEIMSSLETFLANVEASGGVAKENVTFLYYLGSAAQLKPLSVAVFIFVTLLIGAITYYLISKSYAKIVTANFGTSFVYKKERLKTRAPFFALVAKELRHFTSSAAYMLNAGLGYLFEIILGIAALFNVDNLQMLAKQFFGGMLDAPPEAALATMLISVIIAMSSLSFMTACSVSLEGKQLWIVKTIPVSDTYVLYSKIFAQLLISIPSTLICSVLVMIASGAPAEYAIFFIVSPIMGAIFSAISGTVINVAFPKFNFVNETEVIKQSISSFTVTMMQMILGMAVVVLNFFMLLKMEPLLVAFIIFAFYTVLSATFYIILKKVSVKRYASFDV